jgi:hypothetical protein
MLDGQMAQNQAPASPGAFIKLADGNLSKIGPTHVGPTAPNSAPAGTAGNSVGETWLNTSLAKPVLNVWDGVEWVKASSSGSGCWVGDAPPTEIEQGSLWWNSSNGTLYVWYDDGDTQQWVEAGPGGGGGGGGEPVTPIVAGEGLTGGTITETGGVALDTAYTDARYVNVTGDTMTGALAVSINGTLAKYLNNGSYVYRDALGAELSAFFGYNLGNTEATMSLSSDAGPGFRLIVGGASSAASIERGALYIVDNSSQKTAFQVSKGADPSVRLGNATGFAVGDATVNIEEAYLPGRTPLRVDGRGDASANLTRWTKSGSEVARIDANGAYFNNSDERLKTNIQPMQYGLAEVQQLSPKTFNWTHDKSDTPKVILGVIAQEVQQVIPEIICEGSPDPDGNSYLGIDSTGLIHVLINAVKELSGQVEQLTTRLATLEALQ